MSLKKSAQVQVVAELVSLDCPPDAQGERRCLIRVRGISQPLMALVDDVVEQGPEHYTMSAIDFDVSRSKIARNIRWYRQRANLSQFRLAEMIGVSQNAVSQWEHGYCVPRFYTVPALVGALGIATEALYGDLPNAA